MYLCMYVHMYVRMYAYICMYANVRTYVCLYVCMHVRIYVCMCVCTQVSMYVCMYVCMYASMYACTSILPHVCMLYSFETWSGASINNIETLYGKAIKITFCMKHRTPYEIISLETRLTGLKAEIYKRQFKFWSKMACNLVIDRHSSVGSIFNMALDKNIHYLRHYRKLVNDFSDAVACYTLHNYHFNEMAKQNIRNQHQNII